jgi:hypothetical protein
MYKVVLNNEEISLLQETKLLNDILKDRLKVASNDVCSKTYSILLTSDEMIELIDACQDAYILSGINHITNQPNHNGIIWDNLVLNLTKLTNNQ